MHTKKQKLPDKGQGVALHIIPAKKKRCFSFQIQKWLCAIAPPRNQKQIKSSSLQEKAFRDFLEKSDASQIPLSRDVKEFYVFNKEKFFSLKTRSAAGGKKDVFCVFS